MIQNDKYFKLFANILPVKGAKRSIICDVQRGDYRIIPNDLYDLLQEYDGSTIKTVIKDYGEENKEVIEEYFKVLYDYECIFFCDTKEEVALFPAIDMSWDYPAVITNALIDVDDKSQHDFPKLMEQLENLGCGNVEVRFFELKEVKQMTQLLQACTESIIEYLCLVIPTVEGFGIADYQNFFIQSQRLSALIVHSCSDEELMRSKQENFAPIQFTSQVINNSSCCGFVHPQIFNSNLDFVTEATQYNSCLNRKMSIDTKGNIKNCPAMQHDFGHITSTTLEAVAALEEFQTLWHVNKTQIEVCKDCEFRFVCQDCRAFTQSGKALGKPLKCSYNPYTATWEDPVIQQKVNH